MTGPDADALQMLGVLALQRGDSLGAIDFLGQAIASNPELTAAYANLGTALLARDRNQEALDCYDRALQANPHAAVLLFNRGNALRRLGRTADALASYDRALAVRPDHANALSNRGLTLLDLGRPVEALASFEAELRLRPDDSIALTHRALALLELKRPEEALAACQRATAIDPRYAAAHFNLGNALLDLNRPQDALGSLEAAVRLDPGNSKAHLNLGNALLLMSRPGEALGCYDRVLSLDAHDVTALYNRGDASHALNRHEEAARSFDAVLELDPHRDYAQGQRVQSRLKCCDWTGYDEYTTSLVESVAGGARAVTPFPFLAVADSTALQLACARHFVADRCPPRAALWTGERYGHPKIRVAYLSGDFHDHATAYLMAGIFETHDRERFETTAISLGPDDGGAMRARLERSFDRFVDVRNQSDRDVARLLKDLQIDLAVDLKGFTNGARPDILACRPAPVQVNYLGFPGTMGADYIDYILADRCVLPQQSQDHYSERVAYLPFCYQANDRKRVIGERIPSRAELGLPEKGFIFCCFNNSSKLTPRMFDTWMRLLKAVEGSVLWLFHDNEAVIRNLSREALERDVAPERLIFAPRVPVEEHLARQRVADLFLDTLPYNAHTTASDALWAGLPVLTCPGDSFAARVAASLLQAVSLPELIATSLADYENRALALASQPALLAGLRSRLAANRDRCPLFDTQLYCRHLESAYTVMWQRAERGEPPVTFAVPEA